MDDWRSRCVSAEDAVAIVKPGDHVFVGSACATPRALVRALETSERWPADVQLVHFLTDGVVSQLGGEPYTRYQHRVFFVGSDVRQVASSGKVEYIPISVAQVYRLIEFGGLRLDVAFIQVSPPGADGMCSLGVSVDVTLVAARRARKVVAEVNPAMPRTRGDSLLPAAEIDAFVEVATPVIEYQHPEAGEVSERVARYVARIIEDGSTLQIGLGRIPNQMLRYLTNRQDLGIHSDVITDPLLELIEKGVVTGARKSLFKGQIVASYCMGSRRLYDLVNDNPAFHFAPLHVVCDPTTIALNAKMVSITQAWAVDLTGQVCADQFRGEFYGGVAAQPDFLRGAAECEGGKPIVCLASTTEDEGESRIRPLLREGEGVTVARSDVHYVVTEWGIAYLFGKSISERAVALIEIAHPKFRDGLLAEAKRLGYAGKKIALKSRSAYPAHEEREVALKNGVSVLVRPTKASDLRGIQELFYSLTPEDIYTRFFNHLSSLSVDKAQHLCSVSYEEEMAFVAVAGDREHEEVVGSCCYYLNPTTNLADVAYMIRPGWQGLGLASMFQDRMTEYAKARGVRGFTADVLVKNAKMIKVFERSGGQLSMQARAGAYEVTILFEAPPAAS
jgi:acyl-CoA hydrolase/RimJ/RimL family protein N-acetyltransferase